MNKKAAWVLTIALALALICGCSTDNELTPGKYVTEDGLSWVILSENNKFEFTRHVSLSYLPKVSYSIHENELILKVSDEEEYWFAIDNNQLIFQSGPWRNHRLTEELCFSFPGRCNHPCRQ